MELVLKAAIVVAVEVVEVITVEQVVVGGEGRAAAAEKKALAVTAIAPMTK